MKIIRTSLLSLAIFFSPVAGACCCKKNMVMVKEPKPSEISQNPTTQPPLAPRHRSPSPQQIPSGNDPEPS